MSSLCSCAGKLFQKRGPAAAELLSPNVLCVHGTAHDLSMDEQSQHLDPSETKCIELLQMAWLAVNEFITV